MHNKMAKSPSSAYVAICNTMNFDGYYFRKFTMPQGDALALTLKQLHNVIDDKGQWCNCGKCDGCKYVAQRVEKGVDPAWYFLNVLNHIACIDAVVPFENFFDFKDQDELNAETEQKMQEYQEQLNAAIVRNEAEMRARVDGASRDESSASS